MAETVTDAELTAAWIKAKDALLDAAFAREDARRLETELENRLTAARNAERVAWAQLEAIRKQAVGRG